MAEFGEIWLCLEVTWPFCVFMLRDYMYSIAYSRINPLDHLSPSVAHEKIVCNWISIQQIKFEQILELFSWSARLLADKLVSTWI